MTVYISRVYTYLLNETTMNHSYIQTSRKELKNTDNLRLMKFINLTSSTADNTFQCPAQTLSLLSSNLLGKEQRKQEISEFPDGSAVGFKMKVTDWRECVTLSENAYWGRIWISHLLMIVSFTNYEMCSLD